jgi:hypothetical protein
LRARRNRSTVPPPATVEEQSVPQQKTGEKLPVQPMPKEDEKPKDGTKPKEEVKTQQPTTATTTTTPQVQSRGRLFGRRTASDGYERRGLFGRRLRYRS